MTINSPAAVLLAMYVAVGEKQGVAPEKIKGTIQNDVLKEYVARGTYIFPPKPSLRLITNIFQWCSQKTPAFNTISISGYHIREAGSTAVQEVAFTLANGCTYVQTALDAGRQHLMPVWSLMSLPEGWRSSLMLHQTCLRKWPSSGRPDACGPDL
jgi:methylmalonyl-CoA mutase N-terminal domain/subunit